MYSSYVCFEYLWTIRAELYKRSNPEKVDKFITLIPIYLSTLKPTFEISKPIESMKLIKK